MFPQLTEDKHMGLRLLKSHTMKDVKVCVSSNAVKRPMGINNLVSLHCVIGHLQQILFRGRDSPTVLYYRENSGERVDPSHAPPTPPPHPPPPRTQRAAVSCGCCCGSTWRECSVATARDTPTCAGAPATWRTPSSASRRTCGSV